MKLVKMCGMGILLLGTFFMFACSGGGGGGSDGSGSGTGTGTLALELADSSTEKYQAVYITVDEVHVKNNNVSTDNDKSWELAASPKKTYNLLNLINGVTAVLGEEELVAGRYNQIRLKLGLTPESKNNIFGQEHPHACYVILNDGGADTATIKPLKVPSGYQTGVKLVHQFEVVAGQVAELILDFDACRSIVQAGKGKKYILKPTIEVISTLDKSVVMGTVTDDSDPAEPMVGVSVSAQISDQDSARVVRSTLTDDGINDDGSVNEEEIEGKYQLILSPDTSFNIVAFSDAKVSIGEPALEMMYLPACAQVSVPIDEDVVQDFTLNKEAFGTISGSVAVTTNSGDIDLEDPPAVYVSFYASLSCGYVEITTLPVSPDADGYLDYSVDLPLGSYDVVASAEGFIPDTGPAVLATAGEEVTVDLAITEQTGDLTGIK